MTLSQTWQQWRQQRVFRWATDVVLVLAMLAAVWAWQTRDHARGPLPDFELRTLDGKVVTTAELRGKPTLLYFWAPWCNVCRAQNQNVHWIEQLMGQRIRVMSIASSYDELQPVKDYVEDNHLTYPVLLGGHQTAAQFEVQAFPTFYFVDRKGNAHASSVGYTTTFGLLWRLWSPF